jgi:hypothetical protein
MLLVLESGPNLAPVVAGHPRKGGKPQEKSHLGAVVFVFALLVVLVLGTQFRFRGGRWASAISRTV